MASGGRRPSPPGTKEYVIRILEEGRPGRERKLTAAENELVNLARELRDLAAKYVREGQVSEEALAGIRLEIKYAFVELERDAIHHDSEDDAG